MNFVELSNDEFNSFVEKNPLRNFAQTSEFKILRESLGSKGYLLGVKENGNVIAATFVYEIKSFLNKKIFYAPKGYILDYNNIGLLKYFTDNMILFAKSRGGIKIIIDPEVVYQIRNNDGEVMEDTNSMVIENLLSLGYSHFGFNKNFETIQVRFQSVLPLKDTYEETLESFAKSTKANILKAEGNGLVVRKASSKEDIKIMYDLFCHTADNKHFRIRSLEYYLKLFEILPDMVSIYIVSLDFDKELELLLNNLRDMENELERIEEEMKRVNVGPKMLKKQEIATLKIKKIKKQIELNKTSKEEFGNSVNIAALLSIRSSKEYCCITSGMLENFKEYGPKYAMYNAHIKDAFKYGVSRVNFCGISGDFNPDNSLYKIFEIKKGFNGHVEEFIGEFSITFGFFGKVYTLLKNMKRG